MMRYPVQAYGFLRVGRLPEMGNFYSGPPRFPARKQDWPVIRKVPVDEECACVNCLFSGQSGLKVLDLGANIGYFALRVFSRFPSAAVVSVEAAQGTFEVLYENRSLNPARDWIVLNYGVWGDDRPLTIRRRGLTMAHRVIEGVGAESVRGISLASLVQSLGWEQVDVIKVDIEGGEESVVPAAIDVLRATSALVIEVHTDRIDSKPVMDALRAVFSHAWQVNDRSSSKPAYVLSHAPFNLDGLGVRVEL
jgi:FkbM family methyltransferase